uniref:Speriolin C-terminal domain-containing protein n=1 Tax=Myripristis murdjan TaxID=586833 RepID=A0A667ZMB5_9TELE
MNSKVKQIHVLNMQVYCNRILKRILIIPHLDVGNKVTIVYPERLLGEIAFQLDRRILAHVFQGQKRLYGFTLPNIQDKIIQVSTQPLTGRVDGGYRLHLSQRYADLMDSLKQFGYSPTLHPTFGEFIINSYGILTERPASQTSQDIDLSDPDVLRQVINSTAPEKLLKDLLILLSCLCYMAKNDGKPLFYW